MMLIAQIAAGAFVVASVVAVWLVYEQQKLLRAQKAVIKAQEESLAAQYTLIEAQADNIAAYRRYVEEVVREKNSHIQRLIVSLRFFMPDEMMVKPDKEGKEWYAAVDAIFAAEKMMRIEGERSES